MNSMADMLNDDDKELFDLHLDQLVTDPDQDRYDWDSPDTIEHIKSLALSIKARGLDEPIKVRRIENDRFLIIDGECRYRACRLAEYYRVTVLCYNSISEQQASAMMLSTQANKLALKPIVLAQALQRRLDNGATVHDLKDALGKSDAWISKRLSLLKLPESIQQLAVDGIVVDPDNLKKLNKVDESELDSVINSIRNGELKVKDIQTGVSNKKPKKAAKKAVKEEKRVVTVSDARLILQRITNESLPEDEKHVFELWDRILEDLDHGET